MMPRRSRNHMPIIIDKENESIKKMEAFQKSFIMKYFLGFAFFSKYTILTAPNLTLIVAFAFSEYSKIYFPYGIIVRRSIPESKFAYFRHRAPMCMVFFSLWYTLKLHPLNTKVSYVSAAEQ